MMTEIRNGKVAAITEKADRRQDRILVISEQVSEQPTEQSTHQPTEGTIEQPTHQPTEGNTEQPTQQQNGQIQSTEPLYSIEFNFVIFVKISVRIDIIPSFIINFSISCISFSNELTYVFVK